MRTAITAALMLAVLTGCSSSDEDAFLAAVHERATATQLEQHSDQDFIETGEIACGLMRDDKPMPEEGASQVTGVEWIWVWYPAQEHLCPDVPLT